MDDVINGFACRGKSERGSNDEDARPWWNWLMMTKLQYCFFNDFTYSLASMEMGGVLFASLAVEKILNCDS